MHVLVVFLVGGGWWDCFAEDAIPINFYILLPGE